MALCKQLTEDLEMVVLAHLQIPDLIRLSLVCKNWRHMILTSDNFRNMHRQFCKSQTRTLVLIPSPIQIETRTLVLIPSPIQNKTEEPSISMFPCETFSPTSEQPLLSSGTTKLMGLNYDSDYKLCGSHGGLVCMAVVIATEKKLYSCSYKVGNSMTNVWKNCISPPHDVRHVMFPQGIMVDHASNSHMLLASCNIDKSMETEVYDSRTELWIRGATLQWDRHLSNRLIGSLLVHNLRQSKLAAYDFDSGCWSLLKYNAFRHFSSHRAQFFLRKTGIYVTGDLDIAGDNVHHIALWQGHAFDGKLEWALVAELPWELLVGLLDSHRISVSGSICQMRATDNDEDQTIIFKFDSDQFFLVYDLVRCSWELHIPTAPRNLGFHRFIPSLVSP